MFISDFTFLRSKKGCTNYIKTPARKHSRTQTQEKSSNHVNINPWLFFELINYIPKPIAPKKQSLPFIGKRTWASLVAEKTNNITALGCCGLVEKWDIKQGNNYKTIYQLLQSDLLIPKWRSLKPQKRALVDPNEVTVKKLVPGDSSRDLFITSLLEVTYLTFEFGSRSPSHPKRGTSRITW